MKNTFFLILILFCVQNSFAQPLLLETTDESDRVMMKLNYPSNTSKSAISMELKAGLSTSASTAELHTWSNTYTSGAGYAGYAGFLNRLNGLILLATGSNGNISFLTGGSTIATDTRMLIDNSGNIGIGTSSPVSKLQLEIGDMYVKEIGSGVIIKSPNGTCYRLTVDNAGSVGSQSLSCPL